MTQKPSVRSIVFHPPTFHSTAFFGNRGAVQQNQNATLHLLVDRESMSRLLGGRILGKYPSKEFLI